MGSDAQAVNVDGLVRRYGDRTALDGVSFEIAEGETFALLGPNGAGKSTAIEILEGFRRRDAGDVRVLGEDPWRAPLAWRAGIGIVAQSPGQYEGTTVREAVARAAACFPAPRDVDAVLESVGLADRASTRIGRLSGGQARRVDVAVGIVGRPRLLFLDEPTTGFDPEARQRFWALVRELRDDGTAILLTTHYLDEAQRLSDRGAVIADGRIVAMGRVDELGGPDARTPIVRWRDGDRLREVRTHEPRAVVLGLDGEPPGLEIVRPTLEDVYLGLVGRSRSDEPTPMEDAA